MAMNRRTMLQISAAAGVAWGTQASRSESGERVSASDKVIVGVMGVNGRGEALARGFAGREDSEVAYICDVDERAVTRAIDKVAGFQARRPQGVSDFRRILDDASIDALAIAAPNHWHAPATIVAASAGKHVYVEKPCSHTPEEGELAVAAARRNKRVVTMGTQRRSRPSIREAIEKVHSGAIGKALYARTWYNNRRGSIGRGKATPVPGWLDFDLWQGPAPRRPYKDNLVHYNWHWHWHWGNGELGNNGVHALDVARWGMQVDYPTAATSSGGRYRFQDDQETPDTHLVCFEFGDRSITWEGLSWSPMGPNAKGFGITFHGDAGTMSVYDSGYTIYDLQNKEVESHDGSGGDNEHFDDFLRCIRSSGRPTADIEDGHKSTLLCHLGNIAHRVGRRLTTDPANGHILNDPQAMELWGREYDAKWESAIRA